MERKRVVQLLEFITIVLNHMLMVVIAITALKLFWIDNYHIFLWIGLLIVPVFFRFLRMNIRKIALYYGIHALVLVGGFLLPIDPVVKGVAIAILLFYLIWYLRIKMLSHTGEEVLIPAPLVVVLIAVLEIVLKVQDESNRGLYCLVIALSYLVVYFVYYYLRQYIGFMELNEKCASNIPERDIFRSGIKKIGMFCCGCIILFSLTANLNWLSKLLSVIGNGLIRILRLFVTGTEPPPEEETTTEIPPEQTIETEEPITVEPLLPEHIRDIIEKREEIFATIFVIAVICFLLFQIYKYLKNHFMNYNKKEVHEVSDFYEDLRENCNIEERKKRTTSLLRFLDARERIRKTYRKRILKDKKILIGDRSQEQLSFLTAKECCDKLSEQNLKTVYEKARYSKDNITSEDIKAIKNRTSPSN